MSDATESSYYEVALTQRQVLVAFLLLLACLVGAFLSGVWVGRPALEAEAAQAGDGAGTQIAIADNGNTDNSASNEAADIPVLDYFPDESETGEPASEPTAPAEQSPGSVRDPDTTLAEDVAARAATPDAEEQPAAAAPGQAPGKARWRERQEAAREADEIQRQFEARATEADRLQAQATGEPVAPTPAPATPPSADAITPPSPRPTGAEVFVIQVISTRDQTKARAILSQLHDAGYPASLTILERDTGVWYRVRLGPYKERPDAEKAAEEVRRRYRLDTWITSE